MPRLRRELKGATRGAQCRGVDLSRGVHLIVDVECRDRARPAAVDREVRENARRLACLYTVIERSAQVTGELRRLSRRDQDRESSPGCDRAATTRIASTHRRTARRPSASQVPARFFAELVRTVSRWSAVASRVAAPDASGAALYWSSVTFSIHCTFVPSRGSVIAMCVMDACGDAPCQCFWSICKAWSTMERILKGIQFAAPPRRSSGRPPEPRGALDGGSPGHRVRAQLHAGAVRTPSSSRSSYRSGSFGGLSLPECLAPGRTDRSGSARDGVDRAFLSWPAATAPIPPATGSGPHPRRSVGTLRQDVASRRRLPPSGRIDGLATLNRAPTTAWVRRSRRVRRKCV